LQQSPRRRRRAESATGERQLRSRQEAGRAAVDERGCECRRRTSRQAKRWRVEQVAGGDDGRASRRSDEERSLRRAATAAAHSCMEIDVKQGAESPASSSSIPLDLSSRSLPSPLPALPSTHATTPGHAPPHPPPGSAEEVRGRGGGMAGDSEVAAHPLTRRGFGWGEAGAGRLPPLLWRRPPPPPVSR
jgi:hypothetical protein